MPGTAGLEHRIGGLEKADGSGNVSYDPDNHHKMQPCAPPRSRHRERHPAARGVRPPDGDLLILGWGSTYGAIRSAVERLQADGRSVAHAHLRHLNLFPANTEDVLRSYRRVLIPEVNLGQLLLLVRAKYLVDAIGYDRVRGKPFRITEIVEEAERVLGVGDGRGGDAVAATVRTAPRVATDMTDVTDTTATNGRLPLPRDQPRRSSRRRSARKTRR